MHFTHEYRTTVSPEHIDVYGHLNNAQYLQLLEAARWAWLETYGGGREMLKELSIGPVVLEINVQFRRELKAGDNILIKSRREAPVGRIYVQDQEIFNANNELACRAHLKMGFMNLKTRKLVEPPQKLLDVLEHRTSAKE